MEILIIAGAVLGVALAVVLIQIARYEKELRRMAQFLSAEEDVTNARLTSEMRSKGLLQLGKAINKQLDLRQHDQNLMRAKDRELRDGFAYLSHDIRTPLMGARGYLQLVQTTDDAAESKQYLASVDERLGSLQGILDQLFLFTRVSNVEYSLERSKVALANTLGEVLVSFYPQFEERGWTPVVQLEEWPGDNGKEAAVVWADPDALRRVFENLVANMVRHGSGSPSIVQEGSTVTFSNLVDDPQELDLELLFERFYKGQQTKSSGGSGLGLAIVAQLVATMGGQVSAELSNEGCLQIIVSFALAH